MKAVLDQFPVAGPDASSIDRGRIAVGGHGLGEFTALESCGTLEPWHDDCVKAILLFASGADSCFTDDELAALKIPSMVILEEEERDAKRGANTMVTPAEGVYQNLAPPKYLLEIAG
ncbi:MAG: hypothetical protein ABSE90_03845 [Verrucomicrobiota bacterium]|jgi:hypothetical protein